MAFTITPLTAHTGAEIRGLDLTMPIDPETRAALNHAFAQFHVLVVRDQKYAPEDFLQAVDGKHAPACSGWEAAAMLRIIEDVYEAADRAA